MIKIIGLCAVSVSILATINKKIILCYFTNIFLNETISIIEQMKAGCILGKTYTKVYSEIDYTDFKFYIYGTDYKYDKLLTERRLKAVQQIYSQAGKRNKIAEIEYLDANKINIQNMAQEYKNYYILNSKTSLLSSFAVVLIMTILVV